jgi:hypothetical protein
MAFQNDFPQSGWIAPPVNIYLGCKILHNNCQIHKSSCADSLGISALIEIPSDSCDKELKAQVDNKSTCNKPSYKYNVQLESKLT